MKPSEYFSKVPGKLNDDLEFHHWFNSAKTIHENVSSGFIDFQHKIFTLDFYQYVGEPTIASALEIGFGGGRLMLPAMFLFKDVVGIDIHDNFKKTEDYFLMHKKNNFTLYHQDLINQINDKSIDFVYSFIVFQHFDNWCVAENYLRFLSRVLSDKGCGILYFGKNTHNNDDVYIHTPQVFSGFPMTMFVQETFVINELLKVGLSVFDVGKTTKRPWSKDLSGQFYVKFKRI